MEIFYSIQGEGRHAGMPAVFVRLGGCDVGCVWCDVKESWNEEDHPFMTVQEILTVVAKNECRHVIITGGEPLMYDMTELTNSLKGQNYKVHLETSGAYPVTGNWDWVCFSPKKFKKPHVSIYQYADELKPIIFNKSDFDFAEEHSERLTTECFMCLQPEWSKAEGLMPSIIDYVKANPKWNISLQTHKYLNIP
ncbi:MAG: 7-carboxy-7-deazaguanine synthase QueE [Reichenbachiella sp.]